MKHNLAIGFMLGALSLSLIAPSSARAQNQITYAGLSLPNQFTAVNYFQVGFSSGPVTFNQLSAIPFPQPGTTILCSGASGTGCTIGSNPCVIGPSQVVATYVNGAWSCAGSGGGGSGGSSVVWDTVSFVSVLSVVVPTTFTTLPLLPYCWDSNNVPIGSNPPVPSTTTPYTYTFTFSSNQSGYCGVLGPAINPTPPPPPGVFTVTPPSLPFGQIALNTTSAPGLVTLTNNTVSSVTGIGFTLGTPGSNCTDFAIPTATNQCPASLSAASACTIGTTFTPTLLLTLEQCTLTVTDSYGSGTQTVPLNGTGFSNAPPTNVTLTFTNGNGQGSGNVNTTDSNIACGVQVSPPTSGGCSFKYVSGTVVTFTASPSGASTFGGWGGITCTNPCTLTLNANTVISVLFNPPSASAPITIVQATSLINAGRFPTTQTVGDLNLLVASWQDATTTISSVQDTAGNTYTLVPGLNATIAGTGGSSNFTFSGPVIANGYLSGVGGRSCTMNHAAGELTAVHVYATNKSGAVYAISNSGTVGQTWKVTSLRQFTGNVDQQVFYTLFPSPVSGDTITVTYTGSGFPTAFAIDCVPLSGALQTLNSVLDSADNYYDNATSTTPTMTACGSGGTVCPISTVGNNDAFLMWCVDASTSTSSWTANGSWAFTAGDVDSGFAMRGANQINVGTSTYTPTMNGTNTNKWQCISVPFVSASGGSTPGLSESIYASPNIVAYPCAPTCNTVSVTWSGATPQQAEVTAYEYSGMQTSSVVDGTPAAATGTSTSPSSGNTNASYTNDLLFCATNALSSISAIPAGYSQRFLDPLALHDVIDNYAVGSGTYACAPTLSASGNWITELVALKGSAAAPPVATRYPLTITCSGGGSGTDSSNIGGISATCNAGVVVPPNSASYAAGATVTLTAGATSPSTFGVYSGGGCSTNPVCTVTMNSATTVNVSFVAANPGGYNLPHQPGFQPPFYGQNANSVTAKKLPADVMSHLLGNTSSVVNSDLMAKTTMLDCGGAGVTSCQYSELGNPTFMGIFNKSSPGRNDYGNTTYYPVSTDPYYSGSMATPSGRQTVIFHAPNAALFAEGQEAVMTIWDQNSCQIGAAQLTGCVIGIYHFNGFPTGQIFTLPAASGCGTLSNPCSITYGDMSASLNLFSATDNGYYPSAQSSAQFAPNAGTIREIELQNNFIGHTIFVAVDCVNSGTSEDGHVGYTFPSVEQALGLCGSGIFGPNNANRPFAGQLMFLDYTTANLATLATTLPAWQMTMLNTMSLGGYGGAGGYGAYVTTTTGNGAGIEVVGNQAIESSAAWKYYNSAVGCNITNCYNDPFWQWITGQKGLNGTNNITVAGCGAESGGTEPSIIACSGFFLTNIGKVVTPGSTSVDSNGNACGSGAGCYPTGHLHVADVCVAKGWAGLAGGCN